MNPRFPRQFIALFSRKRKPIDDVDDNIDPDGLEATFIAPSLITGIENFEPVLSSACRDRLITFATDATDASLDLTNRVVVGKRCGLGAQADVFEGRLLTNDAKLSVIRRKMKDKEQFHVYLRKHPRISTKVAVKQPRYYRFLEMVIRRQRCVLAVVCLQMNAQTCSHNSRFYENRKLGRD